MISKDHCAPDPEPVAPLRLPAWSRGHVVPSSLSLSLLLGVHASGSIFHFVRCSFAVRSYVRARFAGPRAACYAGGFGGKLLRLRQLAAYELIPHTLEYEIAHTLDYELVL